MDVSVHLLDLSRPGSEPRRLNDREEAVRGVITGGHVVWYRPQEDLSPLNGGTLVLHSLSDGSTRDVPLTAQADLLLDPVIGDRYITADTVIGPLTRLRLYDFVEDQIVTVHDVGPQPEGERTDIFVRPHIAGDLLTYVRGSDLPGTNLSLEYATLPEP